MSELSEILGSLMISLVHARRMADEETAAVAEYYKDHPLLEGMSLPRVRVPELNIDMPITFEQFSPAKEAELDSPANIHKVLMEQLKESLDEEDILSRTKTFQKNFDKMLKVDLEKIAEKNRSGSSRITREAVIRSVDDAFQRALKRSAMNAEIPPEKTLAVNRSLRHRVAQIALKSDSSPAGLKTNALTSNVKENATGSSSIRLNITLREEGLEWANSSENGAVRHRLQPE